MGEFRMPSLGADMEQGVLLEWLTQPGVTVHRGEVIAVVETPKAAVEVETFEDGVVGELLVAEGETVPVGAALATIEPIGVTEPARPRPAQVPAEAGSEPAPPTPVTPHREPSSGGPAGVGRHLTPPLRHRARELGVDLQAVHGTGRDGAVTRADVERSARAQRRRRASPLARRLAQEAGLDLTDLSGSGSDGAIRADDVRLAIAARSVTPVVPAGPVDTGHPAPLASAGHAEPDRRDAEMRASIAALMARSNRDIPHYHLTLTIDLHTALEWMHARNRELEMGEQLVPAALLTLAAARAAREVAELNGHWVGDRFRPASQVDLGLVLSLRGGGLLVPAIQQADRLGVDEMMAAIRELTRRARAGRLRGSDLAPPTISVSNLGDHGVDSVLGVIYPPQVALVGFGAVRERPWSVDGLLGVRPLVVATLSGDHRATDGVTGARLLHAVERLLQRPEEL